uniref:Large ribosomal subunit protein bL21m n=1 Tax=Lates calcarifer TaxID=8187 RepID=A0A4W6CTM0_LATCA
SQDFGRLFAVVHFAGRQWKVTDEDLILIENHIEAECGERIRMEKVLPLLGKELVRVEATVLEKTESSPKVHMRFWRRHRFERKKIIIQPQTVLRINSIELRRIYSVINNTLHRHDEISSVCVFNTSLPFNLMSLWMLLILNVFLQKPINTDQLIGCF